MSWKLAGLTVEKISQSIDHLHKGQTPYSAFRQVVTVLGTTLEEWLAAAQSGPRMSYNFDYVVAVAVVINI
jgi:hypothetical protein